MIALPAAALFLFLMAVYKLGFEKKVQAQENVTDLVGGNAAKATENALKYRKKTEELIRKRKTKKAQDDADATGKKRKLSWAERIEFDLERANMLLRVEEFMMISIGLGVGGFVLLWLFGQPFILALLGGFGLFYGAGLYLKLRGWLRLKKAAEQFAEVLDSLVNCFKTGYGFSRAVQQVADQFDDPWKTEFGKMAAEISLGAQTEDVLNNLADRVPLPDVDLFVTAMVIQRETGGNLAELLGNLSNTCRDRYKLFRKVSAISAQGKLSAGVVGSVPFLLMAMMFMFLPEPTIEFSTHPIGIILLILAGLWMACGIGVLFKIVSIKV